MKTVLRQGTYSLNVYFQSELQSAPGTPGVLAGERVCPQWVQYPELDDAGWDVSAMRQEQEGGA